MATTPPRAAAPARGRLLQVSDLAMGIAVVLIIGLMVVPLPTPLLDVMLALNITTALTILLVAMYVMEPLQFAVFPALLLVMTLFRLGLNVAATRLVLLNGEAGAVIASFGQFVIGGNFVVGVVVFLILMIIQFVVITNGAGRVAEVAARFTLDAMPGKQLAIDADLNAGLINEGEARRRRRTIEMEADFYGAMDGASKFVRGDAIAAVVIVIVNILGGFAIGVLQRGQTLGDALTTYTLLTVGEGLVSQIPALLISTATGIIVTRSASEANLGRDVLTQFSSNPRAIGIASGVILLLALIPGLPKLPFLLVGGLGLLAAWRLWRGERRAEVAAVEAEAAEAAAQPPADNVVDLLQVDPMELEIGYGLIPLVDQEQGGNLLNRITLIRRQLALDIGIVLPTIRVRDNLQLRPNQYVIKLRGVEVARGELMVSHYLAMNPGTAEEGLEGIPTTEPAFGLPALWVTPAQRESAEILGYTVVDPASVLTTHLTEVIKANAPSILTRQDVQTLVNTLRRDYPALVDELLPTLLTLGEIQRVLANLLRERVPVRDLVTILEALADLARTTRDSDLLTEQARRALARTITSQHRDENNTLTGAMLAPPVEAMLSGALQQTEQGTMIAIDAQTAQRLIQRISREMERMAQQGLQPILICSSRLRLPLKRLTERSLPNLVVLSFAEIAPGTNVVSAGLITLDEA
ncbi:MAG TPA: flagellar biosynthesis protein FlhA [Chloroflexota bacterium]|jgi:flagellar biosynthesis protein FlhA|nr:flagellar biosynthesis protein FlhA [Chloroflexota bacterium]